MYQTFYIDSDEEISSIIDRLKKSMATDNYFIIPQRAIFLQSIINLKLLKREADKLKKKVILVTQDQIGISIAQKVGIETQTTFDLEKSEDFDTAFDKEDKHDNEKIYDTSELIEKNVRLKSVGTSNFYGDNKKINEVKNANINLARKNIHSKTASINLKENNNLKRNINAKKLSNDLVYNDKKNIRLEKKMDPRKEEVLEKIFSNTRVNEDIKNDININKKNGGKFIKIISIFIIFCGLLSVAVGGYLFIPSAKALLELNVEKNKSDFSIKVENSSLDNNDQNIISSRIVENEDEIILEYNSTGENFSDGKKASGTVAIYNSYSNESQTLIATTRLETKDGKIFRLVKNIVVPGFVGNGDNLKPGVINAEVVADKPGDQYNLDPADFTVPGFIGGPKYEKFYAKSTEKMTGGFLNGKINKAVSRDDIEKAKKETEKIISEKIYDKVSGDIKNGEILLPEMLRVFTISSETDARVGDTIENFKYVIKVKYIAIIFSENDIREIAKNKILQNKELSSLRYDTGKVEYSNITVDFDKKIADFKVYVEELFTPKIDLIILKKELLGKSEGELELILKKYPGIKNVNIEFSPSFIYRIPQYDKRFEIEIVDNLKK